MIFSCVLLIQLILILLSMLLMALIGCQKLSTEKLYLHMMVIGVFLNATGYFMSLISKTEEAAEFAIIIEYMGNCVIIPFFLLFIFYYCKIKIPKWLLPLICCISSIVFLLVLTNRYHHLYYQDYIFVKDGLYPHILVKRGPLYLIYILPQTVYIITLNFICISHAKKEHHKEKKKRLYLLSLAAVVPALAYIVYITGITKGYNPTPCSYFITCFCVIIVIVHYHLFDTICLAKENILETIEEGFLVFDTNEIVLFFNDAVKRFFPEIEIGNPLTALGRFLEQKDMENIILSKQDMVIRVSIYPVYVNHTLRGYQGWVFDCTVEEQQKKRLVELKEQAEQANMAKSLFLAHMSHEIRTPMNAILGITQLTLRESDLSENVKKNMVRIQHAGNNLLSMINDVLDFSKIESGSMEIVPVNYQLDKLLKEVTEQIRERLVEKDVSFKLIIDPQLPSVLFGDETRLRQIFFHLLNNAVKYTDFGKVVFRIGFAREDYSFTDYSSWKETIEEKKRVLLRIEISDTGTGIKSEDIPKLFQVFEYTRENEKHAEQGRRLGLSIVKHLLELMEGEIFVKSVYGCGSTFTVLLPQFVENEAPIGEVSLEEKKEEIISAYEGRFQAPKARVLAVDDNAINLKVLQGLLMPYKMQVDTALSGLECLEILKKESYDLILMDHMMPELDGIETLRLIRKKGYKLPIIAVTANVVSGAREMFLQEGFQEYVPKPIDLQYLEQVLQSHLPKELLQEMAFESTIKKS